MLGILRKMQWAVAVLSVTLSGEVCQILVLSESYAVIRHLGGVAIL